MPSSGHLDDLVDAERRGVGYVDECARRKDLTHDIATGSSQPRDRSGPDARRRRRNVIVTRASDAKHAHAARDPQPNLRWIARQRIRRF